MLYERYSRANTIALGDFTCFFISISFIFQIKRILKKSFEKCLGIYQFHLSFSTWIYELKIND